MTDADRTFLTEFLSQKFSSFEGVTDEANRAVKLIVTATMRATCYDACPDPLVIHNRTVLVNHHDYELHGEQLRLKGRAVAEEDIIRVIRFDHHGPAERYYTAEDITAGE